MKKKLLGIFVCMLLIATALPAVGTMNKNIVQDLELRLDPQRVGLPSTIPDDVYFDLQYSLHNTGQTGGITDCDIDAPEAWDIETGNSEVVIAVIDTGIVYTHPDLEDNIWNNTDEIPDNGIDDDGNGYIDDIRGWNFYDDNNDPFDIHFHGTHCAGIAGAVTNNNVGIAGVCWDCLLMPLKWKPDIYGGFLLDNLIEAIEYAADNGADIISMSLGSYNYIESLEDAVNYAYNMGVFLVASAGNDNASAKLYPAAFDNVTAVAGTNDEDGRMEYYSGYTVISNYGDWVDVAAPGQEIFSTVPEVYGYYYYLSGTSMAAPHVAGLAALLLSKNPDLSPDEVKALICENVDPYNSTYDLGSGRINAYKALIGLTNNPPDAPDIDGPTNGKAGTSYDYDFTATDPDGNDVKYYIDWGDGDTEWTDDFSASGTPVTVSHIWTSQDTYTITAKAQDEHGLEGPEGTLDVSMPKNKAYNFNFNLLSWLFERFPNAFPILRHMLGL